MIRLLLFLAILFLSLQSVPIVRAELEDSRNQLKRIKQRIESTQVDLKKKHQSELQFSRDLALLSRTLQRIDKRVVALKKEQQALNSEVVKQKQQVSSGKKQILATSKRLEKRLVALYKEGEVGPLKILFSADSPTELVQQYHYLTRVLEYDREILEEFRLAMESHQREVVALEKLKQKKVSLLEKEQQQRQISVDGRKLQSRLLKRVKKEKKQLTKELAILQEKAKSLQRLVSRLKKEQTEPVVALPGAISFSSGRGTLGWPVNGEVLINFGKQKDKSLGTYYESNGVEIAIPAGTSIHAVADGKVVFSDWFNGYGNLLILSHAGGFHTLYAQADKLVKPLGAKVRGGEIVAKSGLGGRDSIYFEIRQNGSPVNPLKWLRRR